MADGEGSISLASFVLDTVGQLRALTGERSADPDLSRTLIRSVTISIPCDQGSGLPELRPPARPLRPVELRHYLSLNERRIVVNRGRLSDLPQGRLGRIELTVEFDE